MSEINQGFDAAWKALLSVEDSVSVVFNDEDHVAVIRPVKQLDAEYQVRSSSGQRELVLLRGEWSVLPDVEDVLVCGSKKRRVVDSDPSDNGTPFLVLRVSVPFEDK